MAVMAAMTPTTDERDAGADGVRVAYQFCEAFGLDGIRVIERVAAPTDPSERPVRHRPHGRRQRPRPRLIELGRRPPSGIPCQPDLLAI